MVPTGGAGMNRGTKCRDSILTRRPPGVERGWTIIEDGGTWSDWHPASKEQNPQEGDEGHFCWERPCWGEGSPSEGPGYHGHLGGRDRVTEPVHHLGLIRGPYPLQGWGLLQREILGTEEEVLPGAGGGEPCPLLWIQSSLEGSSIWRRWRGSPGFWPGISTRVRTRVQLFLPGASW